MILNTGFGIIWGHCTAATMVLWLVLQMQLSIVGGAALASAACGRLHEPTLINTLDNLPDSEESMIDIDIEGPPRPRPWAKFYHELACELESRPY